VDRAVREQAVLTVREQAVLTVREQAVLTVRELEALAVREARAVPVVREEQVARVLVVPAPAEQAAAGEASRRRPFRLRSSP
jgi:hypothetical protein